MSTSLLHAPRTLFRALLFMATIATVALACGKQASVSASSSEKVPLLVTNRGYFDVTIYAMRAPGSSGARIGNVSGGGTASLSVRMTDLQPGGRLVLRVRAVGSRREWISPSVSVGVGATARLNVLSSTSGDMSQSTLYAEY